MLHREVADCAPLSAAALASPSGRMRACVARTLPDQAAAHWAPGVRFDAPPAGG
eukprot:gene1927-17403_t